MPGGSMGDIWWMFRGDGARLKADAKKEGEAAGAIAGKGFAGKMKAQMTKGNFGKGVIQGLGLGAGLGAVGAATAAVGALTDAVFASIDAASDQREAFSLGAQVFEENAKEVEEWAATMAEGAGLATTEAVNFAATFGNAFKNVGFSLDETSEKSKLMTELAADLGSAFNKTGEEAATALRSGLLGESEPLRAFGVFLSEAAVQSEALSSGIAKQGEKLTDNQKVLARYNIIMRQTVDSQGMFGRDSESLADVQKALNAQLTNVSAEIGEALLPAMVALAKFAQDNLVPVLEDIGDAVDDSADAAKDADNPFVGLADLMSDLGERGNQSKTAIGAVDESLTNLVDDMIDFITPWDTMTDAVVDQARAHRDMTAAAKDADTSLGILKASVKPTGDAIEELGDQGQAAGRKLKIAATKAAESFESYRDRVITAARDIIDKGYQVIEDKANLNAATIEAAELRKVIATGKATDEQKALYKELTEEQVRLVVDLAANGVTAGKEVNHAMEALRKKLKTATGNERKAIEAAIRAVDALARAAERARLKVKAATDLAALGMGSGGLIGGNWGPVGRHSGGPVTAGHPYVWKPNEEFFVPNVSGQVKTMANVQASGGASMGGAAPNITVQLLDRMPVESVRDIGAGLRMLGEQGYLTPRRK